MSLFVKVFIFSVSHFIRDLVIVIQEAFKAICNRNYIEFANDSCYLQINLKSVNYVPSNMNATWAFLKSISISLIPMAFSSGSIPMPTQTPFLTLVSFPLRV